MSLYLLWKWWKNRKDDNTLINLKDENKDDERAKFASDRIMAALGTNKKLSWYEGLTENEGRAIEIIKTNLDIIAKIEKYYQLQSNDNNSLKTDLEKYLSAEDYENILSLIEKYHATK